MKKMTRRQQNEAYGRMILAGEIGPSRVLAKGSESSSLTPRQQREARSLVRRLLFDACGQVACVGACYTEKKRLHDEAALFLRQTEAPKKPARRKEGMTFKLDDSGLPDTEQMREEFTFALERDTAKPGQYVAFRAGWVAGQRARAEKDARIAEGIANVIRSAAPKEEEDA